MWEDQLARAFLSYCAAWVYRESMLRGGLPRLSALCFLLSCGAALYFAIASLLV